MLRSIKREMLVEFYQENVIYERDDGTYARLDIGQNRIDFDIPI